MNSIRLKLAAAISAVLVAGLTGCSKVPAGYEGVIFNSLGSDKGLKKETIPSGRYWLTPNETLYNYPLFTQTEVWTSDNREGSESNEAFTLTSSDGGRFVASIGLSYHVKKGCAYVAFEKWREKIEVVTDKHLHRYVQDSLTRQGQNISASTVMSKRNDLVDSAESLLRKKVSNYCLEIEELYLIDLVPPESIQKAMTAKMGAVEKTAQRQNEVAQVKAEADKKIEKARGTAESIRVIQLQLGKSPQYLEYLKIQKWNGVLPKVTGDSTPMIKLDVNSTN